MRTWNTKLRSMAALVAALAWSSAASASPLLNAFPPLPKVVPMMPPTVLHSDTQGEIRFKSSSPYDLDVLLSQSNVAEASMGMGRLSLPAKASEAHPVPAVVILPGGAGAIPGRENETAKMLTDNGIAVFVLDNLKPRGISEGMPDELKIMGVSEFDAVADAYAALRTLNKHLAIDPQRIGLLGFSKGGVAARMSLDERIYEKLAPDVTAFALHVDFFGPCYAKMQIRHTTGSPLVSFRAEREEGSHYLATCAAEEALLREAGSAVSSVVYSKAEHGVKAEHLAGAKTIASSKVQECMIAFDDKDIPTFEGKALIPSDAKTDRQTRYLIRSQNSKALDECVKVGYVSGRSETARKLANRQLLQFLKLNFRLS